jgi:hypothetical protein
MKARAKLKKQQNSKKFHQFLPGETGKIRVIGDLPAFHTFRTHYITKDGLPIVTATQRPERHDDE